DNSGRTVAATAHVLGDDPRSKIGPGRWLFVIECHRRPTISLGSRTGFRSGTASASTEGPKAGPGGTRGPTTSGDQTLGRIRARDNAAGPTGARRRRSERQAA